MRIERAKSGTGTLLGLALLGIATQHTMAAQVGRLDPGAFIPVGRVDDRFGSYNVEMAEVIGAKFWKPYAHMAAGATPPTDVDVGRDPNLFEARAPVDLRNPRLRALAAALGPAYVRVSGTWANSVYFQNDDMPVTAIPPQDFNGVLTRTQWRGVVEFAKAVDAKLVTSFTISAGVRDASGTWTAKEAQPLLDYTRAIGGEIYAAELFNEPNLASYGAGLKGYDAAAFARDGAVFRAFIAHTEPGLKIVGPGDVVTANAAMPGTPSAEDFLTAQPPLRFDVFSYHFYPGVSQRCAPASDPRVGTPRDQALTEAWLARTDTAFQEHKTVRDRYAPDAPIWITETAQAACGGSPWAASFVDIFRYLDQMGRLARQGASVIFHNTLAASEYGLIDATTLNPRPNYWAALLWRRLMGSVVLDAGATQPGVHLYAQCLRDRPGAVALLAINTSEADSMLALNAPAKMPLEVYALTSASLESSTVWLNGQALAVDALDRLPQIRPQRLQATQVVLKPRSIDFIALPHAHNSNCK